MGIMICDYLGQTSAVVRGLKTKQVLLEKQGRAEAEESGFPGSELDGGADVIIKV